MSKYQFMGELFGAARRMCAVPADAPAKDVCRNRHKGNPNSNIAFQSIADRLTIQQNRVLKCLRDRPDGLIAEEIAEILGVTVNVISGRCSELKKSGKIKPIGKRLTRGRHPADVLIIA